MFRVDAERGREPEAPIVLIHLEDAELLGAYEVDDDFPYRGEHVVALERPVQAKARGFVRSGARIRQAPGPGNALGQIKLVMSNPYSVYLHDTPNQKLFDENLRAFSHGCIRVQDAPGLAASLLREAGWGRPQIDRVIASGSTQQLDLHDPIPVYVTYFTAAAEENGELATFPDVYGRDGPVVDSLTDRQVDIGP
ncbi:MAG: hypothetical protein EOP18_10130 [Rhizobiaceae bacterium]|nr:MAG: hypothetical protein EOP18_10130 [Rhizobiaceae bacterium]